MVISILERLYNIECKTPKEYVEQFTRDERDVLTTICYRRTSDIDSELYPHIIYGTDLLDAITNAFNDHACYAVAYPCTFNNHIKFDNVCPLFDYTDSDCDDDDSEYLY